MVDGGIDMDAKSKVSVQSSKQILQECDTPLTCSFISQSEQNQCSITNILPVDTLNHLSKNMLQKYNILESTNP